MIAVFGPSGTVSSTPVIVNVTDACPLGIVTVAGTVASVVSLLTSETTRSPSVVKLRVTVPVAMPPFSFIDALSMVTVNVGASAVRMFQTAGSSIPAKGMPAFSPRMTMSSRAHHQLFSPSRYAKRNFIKPLAGLCKGASTVAPPIN